jgi:hypothetical protein
MPALNHCTNCGRPLRVPDELIGRNVKCPDCGTVFQSTAEGGQPAAAAAQPADDFTTPRPGDSLWDRQRAAGRLTGPAIGLLVLSTIWLVATGLFLMFALYLQSDPQEFAKAVEDAKRNQGRQLTDEEKRQIDRVFDLLISPGFVGFLGTALFLNGIILIGAIQMLRMRTRALAVVAAILACIPLLSPCCFMGIPFGVWALVALFRPGIPEAFGGPPTPDERYDIEGP